MFKVLLEVDLRTYPPLPDSKLPKEKPAAPWQVAVESLTSSFVCTSVTEDDEEQEEDDPFISESVTGNTTTAA